VDLVTTGPVGLLTSQATRLDRSTFYGQRRQAKCRQGPIPYRSHSQRSPPTPSCRHAPRNDDDGIPRVALGTAASLFQAALIWMLAGRRSQPSPTMGRAAKIRWR